MIHLSQEVDCIVIIAQVRITEYAQSVELVPECGLCYDELSSVRATINRPKVKKALQLATYKLTRDNLYNLCGIRHSAAMALTGRREAPHCNLLSVRV